MEDRNQNLPEPEPEKENQKPPLLGSWRNLYFLLVAALILQILVYYCITLSFR